MRRQTPNGARDQAGGRRPAMSLLRRPRPASSRRHRQKVATGPAAPRPWAVRRRRNSGSQQLARAEGRIAPLPPTAGQRLVEPQPGDDDMSEGGQEGRGVVQRPRRIVPRQQRIDHGRSGGPSPAAGGRPSPQFIDQGRPPAEAMILEPSRSSAAPLSRRILRPSRSAAWMPWVPSWIGLRRLSR